MQDEVTKHTKKIYDTAKDKKHSFAEKAKEIIVEVCIIVFAVTLSIWLHSWSEQRHEQQEVREFLRGLKNDLKEDVKQIEENKKVATTLDSNFTFIMNLKKQPASAGDTTIGHRLYYDLRTTRPQLGRYEGFKSSGKIGTIENDELKQNILTYYQQTAPALADGEELVNSLELKMLDQQMDQLDNQDQHNIRSFVTHGKIKGLLIVVSYNLKVNIGKYNDALTQAKKIITQIDKAEKE
ncbi:MAG: hypothetical protein JWR38_4441 [Mucilaginibacter sp.]|nr:hypothetical protein [Mucilaginibacter sp.]